MNYNVQTKAVTEGNVGCEKCHGPGSMHAAKPARSNIVNPARLDSVSANDACIQCHSQGQGCHADKGAAWATEQLRGWKNVSPWRVE